VKSFLEFAALSLAVNVTPGPSLAFIAARALKGSSRGVIVAQGGLATGILVWVVATAVGVAQLLRASPRAFEMLIVAGTFYLVVLGVRLAFERPPRGKPETGQELLRTTFVLGLLTNLLNPYIGAFLVAFLPQFADPSRGWIAGQIVVLGLWFTVSASVVNLAVAGLVRRSTVSLDDARWAAVRRVAGVVLVAFAVRLALAGLL
jgi:threonine/homoserine/homoserine lactone efflux protein